MRFLRGDLPIWLGLVGGVIVLLDPWFANRLIDDGSRWFQEFRVVLAAFALALGGGNLLRIHSNNIRFKRGTAWQYSSFTLIALVGYTILGIAGAGGSRGVTYQYIFNNLLGPLGSTVFSLNAFWIATACYRAFRVRNLQAAVLLVSGIIVMLGYVGLGQAIWPGFADMAAWIMRVPNTAAMRGISMCAALGMVGVGLRVIFGLERGHLGGAKE